MRILRKYIYIYKYKLKKIGLVQALKVLKPQVEGS